MDSGMDSSADASPDAPVPTCNGYEPCSDHPVVVPAGYTLEGSVTVDNVSTQTGCTDFSDCDMWNTHFTSVWTDSQGTPYNPYYNRMGSPFPWPNSRYVVVVPPKTITYAKLHITAPGETYAYSDSTPEMRTDRTTNAVTCFQRGTGHLELGIIGALGGTGNVGFVSWNISVLPGDMGTSGNVSPCQGGSATVSLPVTADEAKAIASEQDGGTYGTCLLREGADYYLNFMSFGKVYAADCSTQDCTVGALAFAGTSTTSDGTALIDEVPCK
jgi:hypothetical protein